MLLDQRQARNEQTELKISDELEHYLPLLKMSHVTLRRGPKFWTAERVHRQPKVVLWMMMTT